MRIIIDNSDENFLRVYLRERNGWIMTERKRSNGSLLEEIEKILKKRGQKIENISGVAVVVGVGRFTATRIATTLANALALSLKIPVCALISFDPAAADKCLARAKKGAYVSAAYSAEAHISGRQSKI